MLRSTGWAAAWSPDGTKILFNDAGLTAVDAGQETEPPHEEPTLAAPAPGEAMAGSTESGIPFLVVRHDDGTLTAVEAVSPYLAYGSVRQLLGRRSEQHGAAGAVEHQGGAGVNALDGVLDAEDRRNPDGVREDRRV